MLVGFSRRLPTKSWTEEPEYEGVRHFTLKLLLFCCEQSEKCRPEVSIENEWKSKISSQWNHYGWKDALKSAGLGKIMNLISWLSKRWHFFRFLQSVSTISPNLGSSIFLSLVYNLLSQICPWSNFRMTIDVWFEKKK